MLVTTWNWWVFLCLLCICANGIDQLGGWSGGASMIKKNLYLFDAVWEKENYLDTFFFVAVTTTYLAF